MKLSVWSVALYGNILWTIDKGEKKRLQAFEAQGVAEECSRQAQKKIINEHVLTRVQED